MCDSVWHFWCHTKRVNIRNKLYHLKNANEWFFEYHFGTLAMVLMHVIINNVQNQWQLAFARVWRWLDFP